MKYPALALLVLGLSACTEVPPAAATPAANPAPAKPAAAPRSNRPALASGVIDTNNLRSEATSSGSRKTVFNGPTGTLLNFESHISTVNPGQSAHTPHMHPHEEMLIVKEGTLEVTIGGKTQLAGPGSIILYEPNVPHATKNVGDVPATYYVFTWVTDETQQPDVTTPLPPAP
jgi:quercetin dioxygenase-like cupin family protein